ncbi:MAG: PorP/SprF family type IX secretion system membrane protein [Saprospiraceae bacterium]
MKKIILFVISLSFISLTTYAQEKSAFTHYHINPALINPAASGASGNQQLFLHARNQWTGFPGAPKTYALSYDGPIGKTFGLGATIYSENISYMSRFRAAVNYAFRYELDKLKIGFGFSTEFSQMKLDDAVLTDRNYTAGDLNIEDGINGINNFDASIGFYGMYNDQTFFGIAFPNIIMARLDGDSANGNDEPEGYYLFNLGHRFKSHEYGFSLEPSILLRRSRGVPFQADINLKGYFLEDKLIGGLSYRTGSRSDLGILVGSKFTNFAFHYTFDVSFQKFQQYSNGAHEITLSFMIPRRVEKAPALENN